MSMKAVKKLEVIRRNLVSKKEEQIESKTKIELLTKQLKANHDVKTIAEAKKLHSELEEHIETEEDEIETAAEELEEEMIEKGIM